MAGAAQQRGPGLGLRHGCDGSSGMGRSASAAAARDSGTSAVLAPAQAQLALRGRKVAAACGRQGVRVVVLALLLGWQRRGNGSGACSHLIRQQDRGWSLSVAGMRRWRGCWAGFASFHPRHLWWSSLGSIFCWRHCCEAPLIGVWLKNHGSPVSVDGIDKCRFPPWRHHYGEPTPSLQFACYLWCARWRSTIVASEVRRSLCFRVVVVLLPLS